ncbi:hypothetical protein [Mesorhizobium sp. NZP2077]|uniref:hypothetical protein n=1 Tax=Mesorhizobium sp. NZP2077 TaxID=2483404 RepID=UPI0015536866|nr:hypothetical protein [Mesorhizobium sp. NZP2077]QKC83248.1 hypothetical protein EB232_17970 [Mesorhizobium sp. NZP2077]QKD16764.1 hypothetical protein HGP13_17750 [Mesorhizobium sp. NZP2077]
MRTIEAMIAGRDAPLAPGCNSLGRSMLELRSHQCRFPLRGSGAAMRFCAVEVEVGAWMPGLSLGSYCSFHRDFLRGQPSVAEERVAEDRSEAA